MAVSVGNVTTGFSSSSDNSPHCTVPAGAVSGDIFQLTVAYNSDTATMTWPSGFTEVTNHGSEASLSTSIRTAIKTATGSESGTFTATLSAFTQWIATCTVAKGISGKFADSAVSTYAGFGANPAVTGASIATGASGNLIIWAGAVIGGGSTDVIAVTPPAGFTQVVDYDTATDQHMNISYLIAPSSTTTTYSGTSTAPANSYSGLTHTLVYTASGGGGGGGSTFSPQLILLGVG